LRTFASGLSSRRFTVPWRGRLRDRLHRRFREERYLRHATSGRREPLFRVARGPDKGGIHAMIRFGFTIRTRMGQRVENVSIIAGSQRDAERRLRQMYVQCEILECRERSVPRRIEATNFANMMDLMAISPPTIQHHG